MTTIENEIEQTIARIRASSQRNYEKVRAEAARQPGKLTCKRHPKVELSIDIDGSAQATHKNGGNVQLVYTKCPACLADQKIVDESEWMKRRGVPSVLLHATFANYHPKNESQAKALGVCVQYAKRPKGFIFLLGPETYGVGKSHLATAIMRETGWGRFITHDGLMQGVSKRYDDKYAEDVVAACMKTQFLVLDELGISRGGSDDMPTLHRILTHRYNEQLPTAVTANKSMDEVAVYVGPRVADRFRESTFKIVTLEGESHRREKRTDYLL